MKRRVWTRLFCVGLILLFALAGCQPRSEKAVEEITVDITATPTETPTPAEDPPPIIEDITTATPEPTPTPTAPEVPTPPKGELGLIGYIYIDNTKVDYPVVVAEDNEYYLDKDPDGKRQYRGSIFMDFRNVESNQRRNVILYGHNNKDQSMFSTLHRYERESFFLENTEIVFELYGVQYRYEIVYTGMVDYREYNHIRTTFADEQAFFDYYNEGANIAQFVREGYSPQPGDQMLTLSTCVSHSIKDHDYKRMIVVARMEEVLGMGEHSTPPTSFGPVEAKELMDTLPERQMFLMTQALDEKYNEASAANTGVGSGSSSEDEEVVSILPPGE